MGVALGKFVAPLRARDGDDCTICGEPINFRLRAPDPMSRSVDHLIPRAYGGHTILANLRLAHVVCNSQRGHGVSLHGKHVVPMLRPPWDEYSSARN